MLQKKQKKILKIGSLVIACLAFGLAAFIYWGFRLPAAGKFTLNEVCFQNHCFSVEIASTLSQRAQGLMFREVLPEENGMLFIFDAPSKESFWMENTLIPLDIIWLDENKEVVFMSKNTQPCVAENCPTITPTALASYALELNAGVADKIGLSIGDKLTF